MSSIAVCPSCGQKNRVPLHAPGHLRCASCHTDLAWIVEAGDDDFDHAADSTGLVLVDLWAPWCGPCRAVAPAVEAAAAEFAGDLKVVKVNVDEAPAVAARFRVQGIPALLLLRDGKVVARQVGAIPVNRLLDWVQGNLRSARP